MDWIELWKGRQVVKFLNFLDLYEALELCDHIYIYIYITLLSEQKFSLSISAV
jgi:hypothetical protein